MAGLLEVFVIRTALPVRAATLVPDGQAVHLTDDFHLIPLTEAVKAALGGETEPCLGFLELTPNMVTVAENLSHLGAAGYCHLEFHGGIGFQAAVAWINGQIRCGPVFTANHPSERVSDAYHVVEGREEIRDMAINVVLRFMGANVGDSIDEFAAVGLQRHRWTEEWAAATDK